MALRHRGRGKAARRLIGAQQHVDLVLGDQAQSPAAAPATGCPGDRRNQLELGAAQIGQAFGRGERQLPSSGCLLLMMSAATSAAAFEAWPAAAAFPVSGHRMPILTFSAGHAGIALHSIADTAASAAIMANGFLNSPSLRRVGRQGVYARLSTGYGRQAHIVDVTKALARSRGRYYATLASCPMSGQ